MRQFFCLALFAFASPAHAQGITGNQLLHACEDPEPSVLPAYCTGFIIGTWEGIFYGATYIFLVNADHGTVADANDFAATMLKTCVPPQVENGQILDVATSYISDNPEIRHLSARLLIQEAMAKAFPCD